jgi:hypothetical protein
MVWMKLSLPVIIMGRSSIFHIGRNVLGAEVLYWVDVSVKLSMIISVHAPYVILFIISYDVLKSGISSSVS